MKNWNEVLEENLNWNGQMGEETVRGSYTFSSVEEKEDFIKFELNEKWFWEFEEDLVINFSRKAN